MAYDNELILNEEYARRDEKRMLKAKDSLEDAITQLNKAVNEIDETMEGEFATRLRSLIKTTIKQLKKHSDSLEQSGKAINTAITQYTSYDNRMWTTIINKK